MRYLLAAFLALCSIPLVAAPQTATPVRGRPLVQTARIDGTIDPATALYFNRALRLAEAGGAQVFVLLLETPGGLDDSMRSIVKGILGSRIPVVVYVWPEGARAASAGAIITLASHIAAMSPGTAIGAAHPVSIGGGETSETMSRKIENDAAAYARALATQRGRDPVLAERIVRESVSISDTEAKDRGLVDVIAPDLRTLLDAIDGRRVRVDGGTVTIRTRDARVIETPYTLREKFVHMVSNPNLAYIFMLLAIYGLIFELSNPGAVVPGVVGGISLVLALASFAVLPVNLAGILLVVLGVGLMLADLILPGHGALTVGGVVAFAVGSLVLFDTGTEAFRVSAALVVTTSILTAAFFIYAVGAGIRAQRNPVVTGMQGMMDRRATVRTDLNPTGKVFIEGELWNARAEDGPALAGEIVEVVGSDGFTLIVRKREPEA